MFPFDPLGALACALYRRRIKFLDVSVLSDVRFSNMGTEWGGYHLHVLLESLLYSPLFAILMPLTILIGDAQFASVSSERTDVVRRSYFECPLSPFFFDIVTLMTFPLVTAFQKGPFYLEQRIHNFVLPGL